MKKVLLVWIVIKLLKAVYYFGFPVLMTELFGGNLWANFAVWFFILWVVEKLKGFTLKLRMLRELRNLDKHVTGIELIVDNTKKGTEKDGK